MPISLIDTNEKHAARFLLQGHVQGIGVRPAVARLAERLGLNGAVANSSRGVEIIVEGEAARVDEFAEGLTGALPECATVSNLSRSGIPFRGVSGFHIERAAAADKPGTAVPRDLCVCDACLREVAESGNRRHGYVFTSCTNCGPRYSIIQAMPYERSETTMHHFTLCGHCWKEDVDSTDRRFHAQTNACPSCGPNVVLTDSGDGSPAHGNDAIAAAIGRLRRGEILAIKGIGGYQLLCDASNAAAIVRLRDVKRRPAKPLAVMPHASDIHGLTNDECSEFESSRNPIVLVRASCVSGLASSVSPGLDSVGILNPTTPLHWMLLNGFGRSLIVTSGNSDGEPLAFDNTNADTALREIADSFLHHNRTIARPIDDSVVRCIAGRSVTIRAGRGIAPLPLDLQSDRQILALGGHQKAAVALCNGSQSILGPHFGDLDSIATRTRFVEQTQSLLKLYGVEPEVVVHDLHPEYFTTRAAEEQHAPTIAVQHHHAHVVAGMLEHGWLDRTVLGIAFDGTGFGPDGSIWGGEFLLTTAEFFSRVASLRPFPLIGGEHAIREPWRVALALLTESIGTANAVRSLRQFVDPHRLEPHPPVQTTRHAAKCTSMGRLFDGVAAVVLKISDSSFEGHAAMLLEAACDQSTDGEYSFRLDDTGAHLQLDWRPLIAQVVSDNASGVRPGTMAMKFHRAVASGVAAVVSRFQDVPVIVGGGCFQNKILTELIHERLASHPLPVGLPGNIPPNDGGLAAGQLAVAAARLNAATVNRRSGPCV
ncbi:MAG: carbamoyltransferase HypF [Planctomycetaceae bacterium]